MMTINEEDACMQRKHAQLLYVHALTAYPVFTVHKLDFTKQHDAPGVISHF